MICLPLMLIGPGQLLHAGWKSLLLRLAAWYSCILAGALKCPLCLLAVHQVQQPLGAGGEGRL